MDGERERGTKGGGRRKIKIGRLINSKVGKTVRERGGKESGREL